MRAGAIFLATLVTIAFIAVATVAADLVPPLKDSLKAAFGHHWVGKGVLALVLFGAVSALPVRLPPERAARWLLPTIVVAVVAIHLFYVAHFLGLV